MVEEPTSEQRGASFAAHTHMRRIGTRIVHLFEDVGLTVVLFATLIGGAQEIWGMIGNRQVLLTDLLLLFIYIEVISMVKVYWASGKLPVRMPMYIAMVALARYLIIEIKEIGELRALAVSASILILALAVLVVRYGHLRFPYPQPQAERAGTEE